VIVVVRHGQTASNARGLLLGRDDPPIDATGHAQAAAAARALETLGPVARVVSSPLRRARETAAVIAGAARVDIDERWIELDYGALEGMPIADVPAETWARWRADPDFAPGGGETLRALGRRVRDACTELLAEAAEHHVVIVTHVSPVKAAVVWALDVDDAVTWRTHVAPGSITRIGVRGGSTVLLSFNEVPVDSR